MFSPSQQVATDENVLLSYYNLIDVTAVSSCSSFNFSHIQLNFHSL